MFIVATVVAFVFTSCSNNEVQQPTLPIDSSISKIEVLDFHSTHRCMTCNAIEANTKYTLASFFASEMDDEKVTFQAINIDEDENQNLAEKFEASGTALILNVISNGKEEHYDLTDFAFMKGTDQEAFSKELKETIENLLKSL